MTVVATTTGPDIVPNGKPLQSGYCFWYHSRRGGKIQTNPNTPTSKQQQQQSSSSTETNNESPLDNSDSNKREDNKSNNVTVTVTSTSTEEEKTQTPHKDPPPTYESSINVINTITTVEDFWRTYDHLVRPNDLPNPADYHFFREGIKPTWEDASNSRGGKWIVRLKKGLASRYWEETLLALIGGQFTGVTEGEICGAVVSIRYSEDIVSIWNKNSDDMVVTDRIRDAMKKILHLPHNVHMEYKPHQASLQDKSSYRNTTVWKPKSAIEREQRAERCATTEGNLPVIEGNLPVSSHPHPGPPRRTGSWGERTDKNKRDIERAWR